MLRELSDTSVPADAPQPERVGSSLVATSLSRPSTNALLSWINGAARAQFRHRLLGGVALGLTLSQCSLVWLARKAGAHALGHKAALASTVYYCFWLALLAGWVRLGGWLDAGTHSLFEQMAIRRGFDRASCLRISAMAYFRWLSVILALPVVSVALVAMVDLTRPSQLIAVVSNLLLSLSLVQLMAVSIVFAVHALGRFELSTARRVWLLICIVPELVRPILPGLPSLRQLAAAAEHAILRWGLSG